MQNIPALVQGQYFHIFNRGNNGEDLFREPRNYQYFLDLFRRHAAPTLELYAYCLMPNHFHLLVRVAADDALASKGLSNLFNGYAQAINRAFHRTGSLFEDRFHRIRVETDRYVTTLIAYIHLNPQRHGFTDNFTTWHWSSYSTLISLSPTGLQRDAVLDWYGGLNQFRAFHEQFLDTTQIAAHVAEDFE